MLNFQKGADVLNASGSKVGEVERIVLNPRSKEISALVVRKGFLFKQDKLLPVSMVVSADEQAVILDTDLEDIDIFENFEERNYIILRERDLINTEYSQNQAGMLFPYPSLGYGAVGAWEAKDLRPAAEPPVPVTGNEEPYTSELSQNIPDDSVALKEGARLICEGSDEIGKLEKVIADPKSGRATHFVVKLGPLDTGRKLIPADWVTTIGEGEVYVGVSADLIRRLAEYQDPNPA